MVLDKPSQSPIGAKDHFQWNQVLFTFHRGNLVHLMQGIAGKINSLSGTLKETEQVRVLNGKNHKSGLKG